MDSADAVVIGAGPNGLVAANMLADRGWDVLVLEATPHPGGSVRTAELTRPGFLSDLCSAFYPLGIASPVLSALDLEQHGLRWRHAPEVLAHVLPDDRCALLSRDLDRTAESLEAFAPGDGQAWRRCFSDWQRVRDELLEAITAPFPPVKAAARMVRKLGPADTLRLARTVTLSGRRFGVENFTGIGAQALIAGCALHTDLGPDSAASGVFGWLLSMLGQDVGFPVPEGGAGSLTRALVDRLTDRGGRIECSRPVTEVLIAQDRAMGVRDAGGGLVRARRAVLADVPAPTLYMNLVGLDRLPARFVSDLEFFEWDDATVKIDWALSGPIPWKAPEARAAGVVHFDADVNGLADFATDLACGRVPERPFVLFGQMTTSDPARSPAGTESAWAYTHVPRDSHDPDNAVKQADRVQALVEEHAPGFGDLVLDRVVSGPHDLQRHNPSLVGGAVNGGTAGIHQQLFFRPVPGLGRADTPIDGLFLASASAHPGGAVHGAPGANAARAALARSGAFGGGYGKTMRYLHRKLYG
ncbi:phytoene desaturase family protein [Thermocrispum municipale]|jgi:phytoene dehydrogenase-like protein|uniref:phytoene desaturase family protein n=1 Tax=Thermocrispum municipale TaxID=37926 RepID=UPI0004179E80|nr:NAD(P)/FAD-dependent oxidoreductase [Thermocrispum municipale]